MSEKRTWQERVAPLRARLLELNAVMTWEGYATLNLDRPRGKDVIVQHWFVPHENGPATFYVVTIFADGSGWNVWRPVSDSALTSDTLEAIV